MAYTKYIAYYTTKDNIPQMIVCYGNDRVEAEMDAKERLWGQGIKDFKIDRIEKADNYRKRR